MQEPCHYPLLLRVDTTEDIKETTAKKSDLET